MEYITGNAVRLKELNTEAVREALKAVKDGTRQSLALATNLSHATCGNILAGLLKTGEVVELPLAESNGGRPARKFAYNFHYSMIALLHLLEEAGERTVTVAVVDAGGRPVFRRSRRCERIDGAVVGDAVAELLAAYPSIRTVAISYPGVVNRGRIGNFGDLAELYGTPLAEQLESRFPVRVLIENDMNLAAIGFYHQLDLLEERSLVYLTFPEGIWPGAGVIANGQLIRGFRGFAGEVSFLPLGYDHPQQLERLKTPEGYLAQVVETLLALTALVNPAIAVLGGRLFDEAAMREPIWRGCRARMPEEFLPELIFRDNSMDDCLHGLTVLALESLRSPVQLIKR